GADQRRRRPARPANRRLGVDGHHRGLDHQRPQHLQLRPPGAGDPVVVRSGRSLADQPHPGRRHRAGDRPDPAGRAAGRDDRPLVHRRLPPGPGPADAAGAGTPGL
ncbi:MAG: hypothetical protein AVDCRST_MAG59-4880, partial [uncultured Thermomicrobiales bacterium]